MLPHAQGATRLWGECVGAREAWVSGVTPPARPTGGLPLCQAPQWGPTARPHCHARNCLCHGQRGHGAVSMGCGVPSSNQVLLPGAGASQKEPAEDLQSSGFAVNSQPQEEEVNPTQEGLRVRVSHPWSGVGTGAGGSQRAHEVCERCPAPRGSRKVEVRQQELSLVAVRQCTAPGC